MNSSYKSSPPGYYENAGGFDGRKSPGYGMNGGRPAHSEAASPEIVYHDIWASGLFLVNLVVFLVFAGLGIQSSMTALNTSGPGSGIQIDIPDQVYFSILVSVAGSLLFCMFYLWIMKTYPITLIKFNFFALTLFFGILTVLMFIIGSIISAILFLLFLVLNCVFYYYTRHRIPFAAALIETVCRINEKFPATYVVTVWSELVLFAFAVLQVFAFVGAIVRFGSNSGSDDGGLSIVIIYLVFSIYWIAQVIQNTLHVSISGTVGTYYFLYGTQMMPSNPTIKSLKRAVTSSFGPICYGSLIVAIIETIRYMLRRAAREGSFAACIAEVIMGCIENLVRYINSYAYVHVALYGRSFCQAAKDTFALAQDHGWDAIMNDNYVGTALWLGNLLCGLLGGGIALGLSVIWVPDSNEKSSQLIWIFVVGALIGGQCMSIIVSMVISGVRTTFVCLAEDPASLARTKPDLYNKFRETYPSVSWEL